MVYKIVYYSGHEPVSSTPWVDDFDSAKEHARANMAMFNADRVAIIDDEEMVVYDYEAANAPD